MQSVRRGQKRTVTLDDLALMVQQGFNEVNGKFDEVNGRLTSLEHGFNEVNGRLTSLERGQEEIQLRLTNVAYRFELIEIEKRVQRVEDIVLRRKRS